MHHKRLSLVVAMVASVGLLATGCASRNPQYKVNSGFYKKMMERQRAGMQLAPDPLKDLPAMTADEYENLGDNYLRQNNINMAFVQYSKAVKMNPQSVNLKYKIGKLFLKKGLPHEAVKEFNSVIEQDPDFALAYEGLGQALFQVNDFTASEHALLKSIELDERLWSAHNLLGIIYDRNLNFDEAISRYQAAIALNDRNGSLYNNLGMSYFYKGELDKAVPAFGNALALSDPEDQKKIYNNVGMTLVKLKRYDQAFEAFKRGSDEAKAHNNMGIVYLQEGNPRKAIASFEKAIDTSPSFYARASENLKLAKMSLAQQSVQNEPHQGTAMAGSQELKPLRLRFDMMLSTTTPSQP